MKMINNNKKEWKEYQNNDSDEKKEWKNEGILWMKVTFEEISNTNSQEEEDRNHATLQMIQKTLFFSKYHSKMLLK